LQNPAYTSTRNADISKALAVLNTQLKGKMKLSVTTEVRLFKGCVINERSKYIHSLSF